MTILIVRANPMGYLYLINLIIMSVNAITREQRVIEKAAPLPSVSIVLPFEPKMTCVHKNEKKSLTYSGF